MRIGIEAQRLFRRRKHGMDIVALELLRQLQHLDTEHEYHVFVRPDADNECLKPSDNLQIHEVEAASYAMWEQVQLPLAAERLNLDLLHCTSNTAPLVTKLPTVLTLHDTFFLNRSLLSKQGQTWYQAIGNQYRRWIVPLATRSARRIVTISAHAKDMIVEQFPEAADRIEVIYNGVSPRFRQAHTTQALDAVRGCLDLPSAFIFAFGSRDPRKNLDGLLRGYHQYRALTETPLPLVLAGLKANVVAEKLYAMGQPALADHIHFPGYIPDADLPAVYALADVFLYPSLQEGFGLPVLEAMASGIPVVTSNTSSLPEVAGDAALLIDPRDADAIGRVLHQVLHDPALQARLCHAGHTRASAFSWSQSAAQLASLYEGCCSDTRCWASSSPRHMHWMHA